LMRTTRHSSARMLASRVRISRVIASSAMPPPSHRIRLNFQLLPQMSVGMRRRPGGSSFRRTSEQGSHQHHGSVHVTALYCSLASEPF
jgi:hypothetical protein